ncbi:hypothetical protein FP515_06245 [Geobacillus thermoleovorans]|uniref:Uncharacterized protein n=2 Tax=Geobacillus thermoleovorans group TaxID=1505648 RepID=A0A2Z3N307_GEOTH|nr:hypothetical protein CWI35_04730 [[Bacillus] caldolyticus]AWO73418.1 hypothetical protein C1N76_01715 [Geobacillus thermoleovorans]QDY72787.1 hypothetical protein FP515_06245 [Geobacillus thermoleovorans]TLS34385.1 hypothetical protein FDK15_02835 [Geobacillus thermoleovorans]TRY45393.1 hypothetical protein FOI67_01050 [Geobacillus sp. LEMMJ02]
MNPQGPFQFLASAQGGTRIGKNKEKGEEKPEEELMGKRKSSPSLATTRQACCHYSLWTVCRFLYMNGEKIP